MKHAPTDILRSLPSLDRLLSDPEVRQWSEVMSRGLVASVLRSALEQFRRAILSGQIVQPIEIEDVLTLAEDELTRRSLPSLRRVINATGIVLHTGLGRAPLAPSAIEAIAEAACGYCNLEYDLETGERGRRMAHVSGRLVELTGAEAALVVNNNAAATLLILHVLARDREVIVSRGQLVEIGGSFRLPDIMAAGGAVLREVGTTNRTRLSDYESAIHERTAMILRVHTSNYRIVGFSEQVGLPALVELAHRRQLLMVDDLGSGALFDLSAFGLPAEPFIRDSLRAGADLVCCSGDKLLGGPQCGIVVGRRDLIDRLAGHPLMRTYRVDKLTLAALEATLRLYADEEHALRDVPALAMLHASTDILAARAEELLSLLNARVPRERFLVGSDVAYAGGGSLPTTELPTVVLRWNPSFASASTVARRLRLGDVPVIVRVRDDAVCFDLRTIRPSEFEDLAAAVEDMAADAELQPQTKIRLPVFHQIDPEGSGKG